MVKWRKARKKPVVIEFREAEPKDLLQVPDGSIKVEMIHTREGTLVGMPGKDYIIRGIDGELYPIKKEIFYKTYEVIE